MGHSAASSLSAIRREADSIERDDSNMKPISRRIRKLEVRSARSHDVQGRTLADVIRERRRRRLAQERGVPFKEVLQEHLAEEQDFWAGYSGTGSIADILRYGRRRHRTAVAQQEPT